QRGYTKDKLTGNTALYRSNHTAQPDTARRPKNPSVRITSWPIATCVWYHTVTSPKMSDRAKNGAVRSRSLSVTFPRRHQARPNSTTGSITMLVLANRPSVKLISAQAYHHQLLRSSNRTYANSA